MSNPFPNKTCANCIAWDKHRHIEDQGECRRAPPMGAGQTNIGFGSKWAVVNATEWLVAEVVSLGSVKVMTVAKWSLVRA